MNRKRSLRTGKLKRLRRQGGVDDSDSDSDEELFSVTPQPTIKGDTLLSEEDNSGPAIKIECGFLFDNRSQERTPIIVGAWPGDVIKVWIQDDQANWSLAHTGIIPSEVSEKEINTLTLLISGTRSDLVLGYTDGTVEVYSIRDLICNRFAWKHTTFAPGSDSESITCISYNNTIQGGENEALFSCSSASGLIHFWNSKFVVIENMSIQFGDDPIISCEFITMGFNETAIIVLSSCGDASLWKIDRNNETSTLICDQSFSTENYGDLIGLYPVRDIRESCTSTSMALLVGKRVILQLQMSDKTEWIAQQIIDASSLECHDPRSFQPSLTFSPSARLKIFSQHRASSDKSILLLLRQQNLKWKVSQNNEAKEGAFKLPIQCCVDASVSNVPNSDSIMIVVAGENGELIVISPGLFSI